jgi:hypothetical protein
MHIRHDAYHAAMTKVRRAIAICTLVLFTCQSILAGVDEHVDHSSDVKVVNGLHLDGVDHDSASSPLPGQPAPPDLIDSDCCHAHGHCHLLAFTGQFASISISPSHGLTGSRGDTYTSLFLNTLLRPPAHA